MFSDPSGSPEKITGAAIVFEAESLQQVEEIIHSDPFYIQGVVSTFL